ncbi:MAG TPA: hypothetical protein VM489_04085 [Burkholderiales bacterium]|jgi:hypothetical protein|nr:hypothetical protein [Burkholderiales bacterium]
MLDFLKLFLPLAGAAFAWYWNERRKIIAAEFERKAEKYAALIESLQGFYVATDADRSRELKAKFLSELNKSWLYCPDEVIRKAYAFLEKVHTDARHSDEVKENAAGELMVAVRKDLLGRKRVRSTQLTANDFKHLRVT